MKRSQAWNQMAAVYRLFVERTGLDFSENAADAMYAFESSGLPLADWTANGFAVGKHWMDVTLAMWRQNLRSGLLTKSELADDPRFPSWWLEKVLIGMPQGPLCLIDRCWIAGIVAGH